MRTRTAPMPISQDMRSPFSMRSSCLSVSLIRMTDLYHGGGRAGMCVDPTQECGDARKGTGPLRPVRLVVALGGRGQRGGQVEHGDVAGRVAAEHEGAGAAGGDDGA